MTAETDSARGRESGCIQAKIEALENRVALQHDRIVELEAQRQGTLTSPGLTNSQASRRDLLRRAGQVGVAAAGAMGGLVLLGQPVSATQGSAVLAGAVNSETTTTVIQGNGGASATQMFKATTAGTISAATALVGTAAYYSDLGLFAENQFAGTAANFVSTGGYGLWSTGTGANGIGVVAEGANGRSHMNLPPAAAAGSPTTNAHSVGDLWLDAQGVLWACYSAGTPGLFAPLQIGGANVSHFVRVSHGQYVLANSDGAAWQDMDATKLSLALNPAFNAQAVISINADLWTKDAGLNQDLGVYIEGGAYGGAGAGKVVSWKESGGFAGTFSPNAAFVETTQPLVAGSAYTIKVRWKTNKPSGGGTIMAGAGPLPTSSSGGGIAGEFSPTRLAVTLILDQPAPALLGAPALAPRAGGPVPSAMRQPYRAGSLKR